MRGLPDPFLREDGSLVKNASEWEAHREYIKSVLTEYLYGTMPDRPDNLASRLLWKKSIWDGEGVFERQRLSFGPENMIEIDVSVIRSARQGRAIPVILQGGLREGGDCKNCGGGGILCDHLSCGSGGA